MQEIMFCILGFGSKENQVILAVKIVLKCGCNFHFIGEGGMIEVATPLTISSAEAIRVSIPFSEKSLQNN